MCSMTVPPASAFDTAALRAAAAAEQQGWDLSRVRLHTEGWESAVLETADGWMLRFPRTGDADFDRELTLLTKLHDRLPTPIPVISYVGREARLAAYRKLTGFTFDRSRYAATTEAQREELAGSIARFLAALHDSLTPGETVDLEIGAIDHAPTLELVVKELHRLPAKHWKSAEHLLGQFAAEWVSSPPDGPEVLLHNDFHTGNFVMREQIGQLAGVWDFSCVQLGAPTFDLRYLDNAPRDLLERVAGHYQMLTLRPIDVHAAVIANRMETLYDILQTHRMDLYEAATARWATADAGH